MQTKDLTSAERDNLARTIGYLEKIANTLSDMKYDAKFYTPIISDAQVDCLKVMLSSVELLNARIHAATELSKKCKNRAEFEKAAMECKLADELDKQGGWL